MSETISVYISKYFSFLWEESGFSKPLEEFDESYYEAKFRRHDMDIRLVKYRRDLYLYLSKPSDPDEEVNLFALVEFLARNTNIKPNYFRNVKDLNECYRMQVEWLSNVLRKFLPEVGEFFSDDHYSRNISTLTDYLVNRYPDLFAKESESTPP